MVVIASCSGGLKLATQPVPPAAGVTAAQLSECDREPIHLLGGIQPHGVLLAAERGTGVVRVVSANAGDLLGAEPGQLLGAPLSAVLGAQTARLLDDVSSSGAPPDGPAVGTLTTSVEAPTSGHPLDVSLHDSDGLRVIELEPATRDSAFGFPPYYGDLRRAMFRLQQARSIAEACEALVDEVRRVTGYDRVMVYRFARDGAGEVVAEARRSDWEPYLGLHYPASDIPVQARALYERNWIRAIRSVDYVPVTLLADPAWDLGRPLDLSGSVLRSVSPVHLEYLRNMGVGASMSVSILRDGRLWGLIACHHATEIWPPSEFRAACELLGVAVSMQLSGLEHQEDLDQRIRIVGAQQRLLDSMLGDGDVVNGLVGHDITVLDVVHAHGASVRVGNQHVLLGRTPTREDIDAIATALPAAAPGEAVATECLRDLDPSLERLAPLASGALAVRLGLDSDDHLMWFRAEMLQSVRWAGNPDKPVRPSDDGTRLAPRQSFALWQQTVRWRSQPWEPAELDAAAALWRAASEVVLRRAARLAQLNEELVRSNLELDAFAYVASHDLKEPLRGIANYATFVLEDTDGLDDRARDRLESIRRLSQRMDQLLDALLHFSQVGRDTLDVAPLGLDDVVDEAVALLRDRLRAAGATVVRPAPLPLVNGDAIRLHEVFVNLLSNAVKYRRPDTRPVVEIFARPGSKPSDPESTTVEICVKDNGIGIPEERLEDIFKIFRRLHRRDAAGGGAGVGLTIARKIVERHGGHLWAESDGEQGSTFRMTLPTPGASAQQGDDA